MGKRNGKDIEVSPQLSMFESCDAVKTILRGNQRFLVLWNRCCTEKWVFMLELNVFFFRLCFRFWKASNF